MVEMPNSLAAYDDIESLVRSARDYVRPADDLRPRVLENARLVRGERRARRWTGRLALSVLVLGWLMTPVWWQPAAVTSREPILAAPPGRLPEDASRVVGYSDSSWELVESFTELRRRQARLLRLAL
jgi:hypothetical protein